MSSESRRPDGLAMPTVWSRVRGLRAMPDGRVPDFWIQCVRPEDDALVVDLMKKHFLRDEETSRALGLMQHPKDVAELTAMWKILLKQRVSLAAWTGWPDGTPRLVGANILEVRRKGDPKYHPRQPVERKVVRALQALESRVDVFARHAMDEYLSAMGLVTLPEFRGQALGAELLRARVPLCRALGLRVSATIFTGAASQKQAAKTGFQPLAQLRYADYVDEGEVVFAAVKGVEAMVYMELVVPPED